VIDWDDVTATAPELSTVPVEMQAAVLTAVAELVSDDAVWGSKLDVGRAYLAAHLATVARRRGGAGPLQSETVGPVTRSFAVVAAATADYGATGYGTIFESILMTLPLARLALAGE
jgi:hypothetical protein